MRYADTPEDAEFRSAANAWLSQNVPLRKKDEFDKGIFYDYPTEAEVTASRAWQRTKFDAGWAGICWPVEYGGAGRSLKDQIIWNQEEAKFRTPPNLQFIAMSQAGHALLDYASPEQNAKLLRPILDGSALWCQLFSEPKVGSDLGALACSARRDGDSWIITGEKIWISDGAYADFGFLLARTGSEEARHKGLTCFVVDMKAKGVSVVPVRHSSGRSHYSRVLFDGARVADFWRIGEVDGAWEIALCILMYERLFVGTSIAFNAFGGPRLVDLIRLATASRDNSPSRSQVGLEHLMAKLLVKQHGLWNMSLRLITTVSRGEMVGPETSVVKLAGAEIDEQVVDYALGVLNGGGAKPAAIEALRAKFTDAFLERPLMKIAGGTSEIQRTVVAERILKLPRSVGRA